MMMRRRFQTVLLVGFMLAVGAAPPAQAQYNDWSGFVGFGGSFPVSDAKDNFKNGWNLSGGFARNFSEKFALQFDYSFNRYGLNGEVFQVTDLGGSHTQQNIFVNAVFFTNSVDDSSLYFVGGGGATHRNVEITRFAGWTGGLICNPWWLICDVVPVPVDQILASRSTWNPGFDVGIGFQIDMGGGSGGSKLFVETRYTYVRGDEFDNPITEGKQRGNTQYVTLNGGFRF
jgi:opacity protein-like surface antigen